MTHVKLAKYESHIFDILESGSLFDFQILEELLHKDFPHLQVKWLNADLFWFSESLIYPGTKRGARRVYHTCRALNMFVVRALQVILR